MQCLPLLLLAQAVLGQPATQQPMSALAQMNILPPAPNAFELTRYSGLPVTMSSGSVSASIPLGEARSGGISIPISLAYQSGNGIKLSQIASRVGMSWTLQAGGVITRSVYDSPDETATWQVPPADLASNTSQVYTYLDNVTNGNLYDSQPDVFSFNFGEFSGKFILNQTQKTQVIMLNAVPLKVEPNFNLTQGDWTFRVIDPKGTIYYFGGSMATEKTRTVPTGTICGKNYDAFIPTAWYLKSVTNPNGDVVTFDYVPCNFDYSAEVSQTVIRTPQSTLSTPACPGSNCPLRTENQICVSNLRSQGVILKAITSDFLRVNFSYTGRPDVVGDSLVSQVAFRRRKDGSATVPYFQYNLLYENSTNNSYNYPNDLTGALRQRPFLIRVTKAATGMAEERHVLSYYNKNALAPRLAYAQDYWGYFNGKNNTGLVPRSTDVSLQPLFPTSMADRTPDGAFAHYGLLSRITYPTGGSDSLIYEANTIYETRSESATPTQVQRSVQGIGFSGETNVTVNVTITSAQNVIFNASCDYSGTGTNDQIHQHAILRIYNASNTQIHNSIIQIGQSIAPGVLLSSGTYRIEFSAFGEAALGNLGFSYLPQGTSTTANFQAGGVRIARAISTPLVGSAETRKYIYAALASQTQSSGRLRETARANDFYSDLVDGAQCGVDVGGMVAQCVYKAAYSTPVYSLEYLSGGHIYYTHVIVVDNDSWANGGTEYQYLGAPGFNPTLVRGRTIPGVPIANYGHDPGLERAATTFVTTGGTSGNYTVQMVREVITDYRTDERLNLELDCFSVRRNWPVSYVSNPPAASQFAPYDVMRYTVVRKWVYPEVRTTREFRSEGNPVITTEEYGYDNVTHLQPNRIRRSASDGSVEVTHTLYPHDYSNTTGFIGEMKTSFLVGYPVEEVRYREVGTTQTILSGSNTTYVLGAKGLIDEVWQLESPNPVPLASFKFSNRAQGQLPPGTGSNGSYTRDSRYKVKLKYDEYDAKGNPLQYTPADGVPVSLVWGYRGRFPVAEVRNATRAATVATNFSQTVLENLNAEEATRLAELAKIRNHTSVKKAEVTILTYDPLGGMTTQVDPSGRKLSYEYDGFGRLWRVKDHFGNIIEEYKYNYRP
ncbi:RHS repeat domain-containing protein [Parapedobacter sp. DT-150]|uniref:RHS repeat domain-containing protein n=1 Tax=Parapedobacter sp. DT-150 TaxID=3396162 RepID=UPI003F19FF1D